MLDPRLTDVLVCPACRGCLRGLGADLGVECTRCGRVYPVEDGRLSMLVDKATPPKI